MDCKNKDKNIEPLKKKALKALSDYRDELVTNFASELENNISRNKWHQEYSFVIRFNHDNFDTPVCPDFTNLDKMISILELSNEAYINVRIDDQYYRYL